MYTVVACCIARPSNFCNIKNVLHPHVQNSHTSTVEVCTKRAITLRNPHFYPAMAGPWNKSKSKQKSVSNYGDNAAVVVSTSMDAPPRVWKKTRSDTVMQAPAGRVPSSHKKVAVVPQAAIRPLVALDPSESDSESKSKSELSASPPPGTMSNSESDARDSAWTPSLDASFAHDSSCSTVAEDVWHFFEKGDKRLGTKSICCFCVYILVGSSSSLVTHSLSLQKKIVTDPARYGKINHKYSATSSISNLCYHIENHHCDEYVRICSDNDWPMMLPKHRLDEEQGNHNSLLSPNPLQLPFSPKNFIQALVKFIVADDQVCEF